jgi:hypothetical protein
MSIGRLTTAACGIRKAITLAYSVLYDEAVVAEFAAATACSIADYCTFFCPVPFKA